MATKLYVCYAIQVQENEIRAVCESDAGYLTRLHTHYDRDWANDNPFLGLTRAELDGFFEKERPRLGRHLGEIVRRRYPEVVLLRPYYATPANVPLGAAQPNGAVPAGPAVPAVPLGAAQPNGAVPAVPLANIPPAAIQPNAPVGQANAPVGQANAPAVIPVNCPARRAVQNGLWFIGFVQTTEQYGPGDVFEKRVVFALDEMEPTVQQKTTMLEIRSTYRLAGIPGRYVLTRYADEDYINT